MSSSSDWPHLPVLLSPILETFSQTPLHYFIDGTVGAGGHAEAILQAHPEIVRYLAIDQDPEALTIAQKRLIPWQDKVIFQQGNFENLTSYLSFILFLELMGCFLI
jgi:16S rRNA (cytosine1402-N4)-methyltransferase